ncbi:hypothetical protein ACGF07_25730 [Kitasatospora sp. NPDC048194]|uniref:hypothetical protein n=1 Tax=Kitasatospora sp. NPDC048194 TaxID=3364045 RepID=UPI003719AC40
MSQPTVISEQELNALLDATLAAYAEMHSWPIVYDDPVQREMHAAYCDLLYGPLPELPAWSSATEALVAEWKAA